MQRRINSRIPSDFASQARRAFWAKKQAESQADALAEQEKNRAIVSDWQSRFNSARNAPLQGQKNFRGVN